MRDALSATDLKSKLDLRLVDLGVGMPAALAAQMLSRLGARTTRIEPQGGDPFYDVYPAYRIWRTEPKGDRASIEALDTVLADADVCLIGGESYPGLDWSFDADALAARFPKLVVLQISGYATRDAVGRPAVDLLVQARTGLVNEHFTDRSIALAFPATSYGAALLGVLGVEAALLERDRSGLGQVVRTSLQQGAALWTSGNWSAAEKPDMAFDAGTPKDVKQPIFKCADGKYVMLTFGTPGALATIYRILGIDIPVDPKDRNMPDIRRGPVNYFCDRSILEPGFAKVRRDEVLVELWKGGVAADAVQLPGEAWSDEQAVANGIVATVADGWQTAANPIAIRVAAPEGNASGRRPAPKGKDGPLSGLRVVDLGSWVAGPYGAKLLGDLGADVVKVELLEGEPFRVMYRYHASSNRGKRSIAIDLKKPEGLALVQKLCANADAVTHNMRVGVAERIGVDPKSLRKLNPKLVTLHSSAYGSAGPKALNSGWDPVLQPYCGHSTRAGGAGNDPLVYAVPILDYGAGITGAIAMLAGLRLRDRLESGVELESNLLSVGLYLMSELIRKPDGTFVGAPDLNAEQTGFHPAEALYRVKDGWIAVAARTDAMAASFARVLDLDLGPKASWGTRESASIAKAVSRRTVADLLGQLERAGVWAEACAADAWASLAANADAKSVGIYAERVDPTYGRLSAIGQLVQFSRSPLDKGLGAIVSSGENTREILSELGLGAAEIDTLYEKRVIA